MLSFRKVSFERMNSNLNLISLFRIFIRLSLIILILLIGCLVFITVRVSEKPFFKNNNVVSGFITTYVCKVSLVILGFNLSVNGRPMAQRGALVSNHVSWLDIFALNSITRLYFTAKSEVSGWPVIGWLANLTGTVFVKRSRTKSKYQVEVIKHRLRMGQRIIFFPEGTSSDGTQVLSFKSTLFESFFENEVRDIVFVQPVTIFYLPNQKYDPTCYAWFDEMSFVSHFLWVLSLSKQGQIKVIFHEPLKVSDYGNRKQLTESCRNLVEKSFIQLSSKV